MRFETKSNEVGDVTCMRMEGDIDQSATIQILPADVKPTLVLNLSKIARINSIGVREWVKWIQSQYGAQKRVVCIECPPSVVMQINHVEGFMSPESVYTFFAPYYCAECDGNYEFLLDASKLNGAPSEAPAVNCPDCNEALEFDDMEDVYFSFLDGADSPSIGPEVRSAVVTVTDHEPGSLRQIK